MFSLSFYWKYCLISLVISSLTHGLLKRVLLNFQIYRDFLDFIIDFQLNYIWSENQTLNYFDHIKIFKGSLGISVGRASTLGFGSDLKILGSSPALASTLNRESASSAFFTLPQLPPLSYTHKNK